MRTGIVFMKGNKMDKLATMWDVISPFGMQIFGWLAVFLAPIQSVMLAVGALIMFDLITGIWASKKAGRPITSFGLRRTIVKSFAYQMSIITAMIMENYFMPEIPIIRIIAGMIALTEFKSFLENITQITKVDLWRAILDRLHIEGKKVPYLSDDASAQEVAPTIPTDPNESPSFEPEVLPEAAVEEKVVKTVKKSVVKKKPSKKVTKKKTKTR